MTSQTPSIWPFNLHYQERGRAATPPPPHRPPTFNDPESGAISVSVDTAKEMDHLLDSFVPWCPPKSESMVCHRYIPVSFTLVLFPSLSTYSVSFTRSAHILFPSLALHIFCVHSAHIMFPSLCTCSVYFALLIYISSKLSVSFILHIFCVFHFAYILFPSLCTYSVSFSLILFPSDSVRLICLYKER